LGLHLVIQSGFVGGFHAPTGEKLCRRLLPGLRLRVAGHPELVRARLGMPRNMTIFGVVE
jgi:hypothetical protein